MEFKLPYLLAMRERAPKMFNQLRRSGEMDAHLQMKSEEAHRMFEELTADEPKLPNGLPTSQSAIREAEEIVLATLINFATEDRKAK